MFRPFEAPCSALYMMNTVCTRPFVTKILGQSVFPGRFIGSEGQGQSQHALLSVTWPQIFGSAGGQQTSGQTASLPADLRQVVLRPYPDMLFAQHAHDTPQKMISTMNSSGRRPRWSPFNQETWHLRDAVSPTTTEERDF